MRQYHHVTKIGLPLQVAKQLHGLRRRLPFLSRGGGETNSRWWYKQQTTNWIRVQGAIKRCVGHYFLRTEGEGGNT